MKAKTVFTIPKALEKGCGHVIHVRPLVINYILIKKYKETF